MQFDFVRLFSVLFGIFSGPDHRKTRIGGRTATIGNKDPVVEHKGIVEQVGAFSLATSVRSVLSAVGQTALRVRLMFDAGITAKKFVQKRPFSALICRGTFFL